VPWVMIMIRIIILWVFDVFLTCGGNDPVKLILLVRLDYYRYVLSRYLDTRGGNDNIHFSPTRSYAHDLCNNKFIL